MAKKQVPLPLPPPVTFVDVEQIERAMAKLRRRIEDVDKLKVREAYEAGEGQFTVLASTVKNTIREVFGEGSPEFQEHQHLSIWSGPMILGMGHGEAMQCRERGKKNVINVISSLIDQLKERAEDFDATSKPHPSSYFSKLNLHPRILEVAEERFMDGYHWDAVFAAAKALVNYVKERSGSELDGTKLMYAAFSRTNPLLAFNDLRDATDGDEQEGIMHMFVGAALAIRNPGGHSFPEGSEQRAIEYISFISMLAYLVQEAKKRKPSP